MLFCAAALCFESETAEIAQLLGRRIRVCGCAIVTFCFTANVSMPETLQNSRQFARCFEPSPFTNGSSPTGARVQLMGQLISASGSKGKDVEIFRAYILLQCPFLAFLNGICCAVVAHWTNNANKAASLHPTLTLRITLLHFVSTLL